MSIIFVLTSQCAICSLNQALSYILGNYNLYFDMSLTSASCAFYVSEVNL